jgi:hypothetical protein
MNKEITEEDRYACLSNPFYNPLKDGWWADPEEYDKIVDKMPENVRRNFLRNKE